MNLCFDTGYAALAGGAGGGMPTGAAGGDLSGTYPNPTVRASSTSFQMRSSAYGVLSANTNDWGPSNGLTGLGSASTVSIQTDGNGPWNLTGLDISAFIPGASSGTNTDDEGVILIIQNNNIGSGSAYDFVLKANDGASSATNQFGFSSDVTLSKNQSAIIRYDTNFGFWRLIAVSNSAGVWTLDSSNNLYSTGAGNGTMTGHDNIMSGVGAGLAMTGGVGNILFGKNAGGSITNGINNVAYGLDALALCTDGSSNTAIGNNALARVITGNQNTCAGAGAGYNYVSDESYNVLIANTGVATDQSVIRIGTNGDQYSAYIAGILGVTPGGTPDVVIIGTGGQLGSVAASSLPGVWTLDASQNLYSTGAGNGGLVGGGAANNLLAGVDAGHSLTSGSVNVYLGPQAGFSSTSAGYNVGIGYQPLQNLVDGLSNVSIGAGTGSSYTGTESFNVLIGAGVAGVVGESNTIRIGASGTHLYFFVAGTSAIVGDNTVSGTNNFIFGYNGSITGNDNTACGISAGIVGNSCLALGNSTYAGADDAVSIGNFSQASAAKANAIGYNAIANVESTTAVTGPFISPVSAAAPSPSDRWRLMGDGGWICRTEAIDLTATQTIEIDLPTGAYCNIDEVGIIINDPNTNSVLTPASASFGISGSNAKYLAATPMATAVAFGKRDLFTTLLADDGENTLTVEITTAATVGGGGELKGYAYWKVQVWPSET